MNYLQEINKLEDLYRKNLHEIKALQEENSKISASIAEYNRCYTATNNNAMLVSKILEGKNRTNVRAIIRFILSALGEKPGTELYKRYKNTDLSKVIDADSFIDVVIIEIGKPMIDTLMRMFDCVAVIDGEERLGMTMEGSLTHHSKTENFNKRLHNKLCKPNILASINQHLAEQK